MDDPAILPVPVTITDVEVMVEVATVSAAGSEPTSAAGRTANADTPAEQAIIGVAESIAGTVDRLADEATHAKGIEVELGLVDGNVNFAKGKAGATLAERIRYDAAR